jgi:hypothetical protein
MAVESQNVMIRVAVWSHRSTACAPADHPDQVMLAGGGVLDSEGPPAVTLAAVLPRGAGAQHVLGDLPAVAPGTGLAGARILVSRHDGCAAGGLAHSV